MFSFKRLVRCFISLGFVILLFSLLLISCKTSSNDKISDLRPPEQVVSELEIMFLNYFEEGDSVFVVGVVSNTSNDTRDPMLSIEFFDAQNSPVSVTGTVFSYADTVHTHNTFVLPRGWSGFSYSILKSRIKGNYSKVVARPIGGRITEKKYPIIFENQGFYKEIATKDGVQTEKSWIGQGNVLNPFMTHVTNPFLEFWVFGTDEKLYSVTKHDLFSDTDHCRVDNKGPIEPQEKRPVSLRVDVSKLPKAVQNVKVGKIDIQAFQ